MIETQSRHKRPTETENGQLIVYTHIANGNVQVTCPALGYTLAIDGAYDEESAKKSFEAALRRNSKDQLDKAATGEQYTEERLRNAKRLVGEDGPLPLVFVQNFDVSSQPD